MQYFLPRFQFAKPKGTGEERRPPNIGELKTSSLQVIL
jgi:hypothetical protein